MSSPLERPLRQRRPRSLLAGACITPLERRVLLASAFIDPPAAPQTLLNTTYVPGAGQTITVNSGGNLQTAINNAQLGDTIVVQAGATFTGNFTLPNKTTGSGWITIRTSAPDSDLPAQGTRVTPLQSSLMPKIVSNSSTYALSTTNGAHHYRFIGVEFTVAASVTSNFGIVVLGSGAETSATQFPHDLIFDRCYIHGNATGNIQNGMRLNSASTAVIDSYFDQCQATTLSGSFESHCIGGYNGPGPYKLVDNTFSSACIPVIFGGATTSMNGMVPSDMEIRNNYFTRPRSWRPGDPNYVANNWYVKNLFELKNAQRVLFDGNVLENNWPQAGSPADGSPQQGYAILLNSRDQSGAMPWATVQDITLTNNIIRHSTAGFSLYGAEGTHAQKIKIANNLLDDIGLNWGSNDRSGMFAQFQTVGDTQFDHNTIINDGDIMFCNGVKTADVDFTNNIVNHNAARTINNNKGINGVGTGVGTATLNAQFNQYSVTKNAMANSGTSSSSYTGAAAGNFFPASFSNVGFTDQTNHNYRLSASSIYRNAGTDGKDLGADFTALESAVGGAMTMQITGTSGNDTFYVKRNGNLLNVYNNATGTGTPIQRDMFVYYESLMFDTGDGDDRVIFDLSGGNPIPVGGAIFHGGPTGASPTGGNDIVQIFGNGAAATYAPSGTFSGLGKFTVAGAGVITFLGAEGVEASNLSSLGLVTPNATDTLTIDTPVAGTNRISGSSGGQAFVPVTLNSTIPLTIDAASHDLTGGSTDSIGINAASGSSIRFIGGAGNDAMTINGGTLAFNSDLGTDSSALALTVGVGANVTFGSTQHLRSLTVNGLATMSSDANLLFTNSLSITGGKLDLGDNALVVEYSGASPIAQITGLIQSGRNGGAWNGNGIITSQPAVQSPTATTTVGISEASSALNISGSTTAQWNGQTVDATAILVAYTLLGDANLDRSVNSFDFNALAGNFNNSASASYARGDFNYDGRVNALDFNQLATRFGAALSASAPMSLFTDNRISTESTWKTFDL